MRTKQLLKKIRKEFKCMHTGWCCRVRGYVYLKGRDIKRIAKHLQLSREEFLERYCGKSDTGSWALHSRADDACIFLSDRGCEIHEVKPAQCRDFPFKWRDVEAYECCEGIKALMREAAGR